MAYIGNTAEQQGFIPAVDFFSGNGSTTAFTLSRPVASVAQVQATIENVPQNPGTAFTVSGNTITFDGAPASGTNNIYVYYTSPITQVIQPGQGTVGTAQIQSGVLTPTAVSDQANTSTGYFDIPAGTTAQRPGTPVLGALRLNTTFNFVEVWNGSAWVAVGDQASSYAVESITIAGGGGGGARDSGGGGGAGGLLYTASTTLTTSTAYTVTVGAGGAGRPSASGNGHGTSGSNSVFGALTAIGGGGGGGNASGTAPSGGSGGGGSGEQGNAGGAGTSGQGNVGGTGQLSPRISGGGGGAGAGGNDGSNTNGKGGNGLNTYSTWATATSTGASGYYAGGGGGSSESAGGVVGAGGLGGGGAGNVGSGNTGVAGTTNTGGGGGGAGTLASGGAGGSGIVIIRYAGSQRGTGGTIVTTGGFTYHTFTSSGTYTA
jgi:hypothetical protein